MNSKGRLKKGVGRVNWNLFSKFRNTSIIETSNSIAADKKQFLKIKTIKKGNASIEFSMSLILK